MGIKREEIRISNDHKEKVRNKTLAEETGILFSLEG